MYRTKTFLLAVAGLGLLVVSSGLAAPTQRGFSLSDPPAVTPSLPLARVSNDQTGLLFSLDGNRHTVAVPAPGGGWWLGTPSGVKRVDKDGKARLYTVADGLPAAFIEAVALAPDGTTYCVARGGTVPQYNNIAWKYLAAEHALPRSLCVYDAEADRWRVLKTVTAPTRPSDNYGGQYHSNNLPTPGLSLLAAAADRVVFVPAVLRGDADTEMGWVYQPANGQITALPWDEATRTDNALILVRGLQVERRGLTLASSIGVLQWDWNKATWRRLVPNVSADVAVFSGDTVYLVGRDRQSLRVEAAKTPFAPQGEEEARPWHLTRLDLVTGKTDTFTPPATASSAETVPLGSASPFNRPADTDLTVHAPVALSVGADGTVWTTHRGVAPGGMVAYTGPRGPFYGGWMRLDPKGTWTAYPLRRPLAPRFGPRTVSLQIGGAETQTPIQNMTFTRDANGRPRPASDVTVTAPPTPFTVIPDMAYLPFCLISARSRVRSSDPYAPPFRSVTSGGVEAENDWIRQRFPDWLLDDKPALPPAPALQTQPRLTAAPAPPDDAVNVLVHPDSDNPGMVWTTTPNSDALIYRPRASAGLPVSGEQRKFPLPVTLRINAQIPVGSLTASGSGATNYLWLFPTSGIDKKLEVLERQGRDDAETWAEAPYMPPPPTLRLPGSIRRWQSNDVLPVADGASGALLMLPPASGLEPTRLVQITPPAAGRGGAYTAQGLPIALPFGAGSDAGPSLEPMLVPRLDATRTIWVMTQRLQPDGGFGGGNYTMRNAPYQVCRLPAPARGAAAVGREAWQAAPETLPARWTQALDGRPFVPRPVAASDTIIWFEGQTTVSDVARAADRFRRATQPAIVGYDMVRRTWTAGQPVQKTVNSHDTPSLVADPAGGDGAILAMSSGQGREPTVYGWRPAAGAWGVVAPALPEWATVESETTQPTGRIVRATRAALWVIAYDRWLCRWDRVARRWDAQTAQSSLPPALIHQGDAQSKLSAAWTHDTLFAGNSGGLYSLALASHTAAWHEVTRSQALPSPTNNTVPGRRQLSFPNHYAVQAASVLPVGGGVVYALGHVWQQGHEIIVGLRLDSHTGKWRIYDGAAGFPQQDTDTHLFWDGREAWAANSGGVYRRDGATDTWRVVYRGLPVGGDGTPPPPLAARSDKAQGRGWWKASVPATRRDENAYLLMYMEVPAPTGTGTNRRTDSTTKTVLVRWNTRTGETTLLPPRGPVADGQGGRTEKDLWVSDGVSLLADGPDGLLVGTDNGVWRVNTQSGDWQGVDLPLGLSPQTARLTGLKAANPGPTANGDIWVLTTNGAFLWHNGRKAERQ